MFCHPDFYDVLITKKRNDFALCTLIVFLFFCGFYRFVCVWRVFANIVLICVAKYYFRYVSLSNDFFPGETSCPKQLFVIRLNYYNKNYRRLLINKFQFFEKWNRMFVLLISLHIMHQKYIVTKIYHVWPSKVEKKIQFSWNALEMSSSLKGIFRTTNNFASKVGN